MQYFKIETNQPNIVKFITLPVLFPYHFHNRKPSFAYMSCHSLCNKCDGNSAKNNIISSRIVGIISRNDDKKYLLKMNSILYRDLSRMARNKNINFLNCDLDIRIDFCDSFPKLPTYSISIIESSFKNDWEEDIEFKYQIYKFINPMFDKLSHISSNQEFREYYLFLKKFGNSKLFDELNSMVENQFPQHLSALQKLKDLEICFS